MVAQRRQVVGIVGVALPGGWREVFGIGEIERDPKYYPLLGTVGVDRSDSLATRVVVKGSVLTLPGLLLRLVVPAVGE